MTKDEHIESLTAENSQLEAWIDDLQSGMYINCVYCGHRYGPNSDPYTKDFHLTMRKALEGHIASCPKHPLSAAKKEIAALKKAANNHERLVDVVRAMERARDLWLPMLTDAEHEQEAAALHELRNKILAALKEVGSEITGKT